MVNKTDFSKIPESDAIINFLKARHQRGLYSLTLATGLPGTGKSSACQRLGELISMELHGENQITEKNIVDSLLGFLRVLRNVKKPGHIIIIEEVSVLFPSRRAMSGDNVDLAKVLDTCRKKQVIIFANAPIYKSIDSHMRAMSHFLVETLRIYKTQEVVSFKGWRLQTNPHSGKTYRHTLQRKGREVNLFFTRQPNSEVWEEYEQRKDKFMDELYNILEAKANKKKEKELKDSGIKMNKTTMRDLSERELQVHAFRRKGLKDIEIARKLDISSARICVISKNIRKKLGITKENEQTSVQTVNCGTIK